MNDLSILFNGMFFFGMSFLAYAVYCDVTSQWLPASVSTKSKGLPSRANRRGRADSKRTCLSCG